MMGIPGSGKSTWIKNNLPEKGTKIVSADHFWIRPDGSYKFDSERHLEAHRNCMLKFLNCFQDYSGIDTLVVDNTNIRSCEFAPYVAVAQAYNMKVRIVRVDVELQVALDRQTHGVPGHTMNFMHKEMYMKDNIPYRFKNLVEYYDEEE